MMKTHILQQVLDIHHKETSQDHSVVALHSQVPLTGNYQQYSKLDYLFLKSSRI